MKGFNYISRQRFYKCIILYMIINIIIHYRTVLIVITMCDSLCCCQDSLKCTPAYLLTNVNGVYSRISGVLKVFGSSFFFVHISLILCFGKIFACCFYRILVCDKTY